MKKNKKGTAKADRPPPVEPAPHFGPGPQGRAEGLPPAGTPDLRRRAEERIRGRQTASGIPRTNPDLERLVQELQVHQIELEMQNDELRRAQEEIEAGLRRYTELYDFAPVGYFTFDRDGTILQLNFTGAKLLGMHRSRLVNRRLGDMLTDESRPCFDTFLAKVSESPPGLSEVCEVDLRQAQGAVLRLQIEAGVGDAQDCRAVVTDITDRKLLERQRAELLEAERAARGGAERANRAKDEFLATISHELRSPLSAILGWARLARKRKRKDADHALDIIERSALSLTQLIDDLLDMSRITSGKIRLTLRTVDPVEMIQAVTDDFLFAAQAKGITLEQQLQQDLRPVRCDSGRIRQVLANLLANAIKFTPQAGRICVRVEQDAVELRIRVTDSGKGISPEFLSRVFGKFQQADASITREHGGLGLGLAIVSQLVEMHQGKVQVESGGEGQGATFTVTLPAAAFPVPGVDGPESIPAGDDDDEDMLPDGLVVLVVDDEPETCELLGRVLEDSGARVLTAHSASEAWNMLPQDKPDVLLCDISMPGEDGYTLIGRIRSAQTWHADVACIALTAMARPEDREHALRVGFDEHLSKTIHPSELVRIVRRFAWKSMQRRLARQRQELEETTFALDVRPKPDSVTGTLEGGPALAASVSDEPAHVLVAEDDETLSELTKLTLEDAGHRVSVVASVADGVALAGRMPVDLLVCDLQLKDGTGWELMSRLREIGVTSGIVISGRNDEASVAKSIAAGFSRFLTKPVEESALLDTVSLMLNQAGRRVR